MPNWIQPQEGETIRAAVVDAERRSRGEIVPVLLSAADDYEVAYWKAATLGAQLLTLIALAGVQLDVAWSSSVTGLLLPGLAGALLAALAVLAFPPLRPWLAGREKVEQRIGQRAREAFLAYEVFKTREGTGVLICVFTLEHRVVVLADEGIHRVAPPGTWDELARETAREMRLDGSSAALLAAVKRCGEILAERGLHRREDDANELRDELRGEFR